MDRIELNNGIRMPQLGFGVFQITDLQICKESVKAALETGYRMIDTAACYGNEAAVGEAIRESDIGQKYGKTPAQVSVARRRISRNCLLIILQTTAHR
ncbi:MAG: aldo/keto reductase [Eubacteriales bacterium]|nr:aldo/keto reductase [Eubacteriales bacterium]